ncbi:hypothetical protein ACI8AC_23680 [Geodermatophilus sp. SYSU D00758]
MSLRRRMSLILTASFAFAILGTSAAQAGSIVNIKPLEDRVVVQSSTPGTAADNHDFALAA